MSACEDTGIAIGISGATPKITNRLIRENKENTKQEVLFFLNVRVTGYRGVI